MESLNSSGSRSHWLSAYPFWGVTCGPDPIGAKLSDRYNTALATVPDQRCTASLSLALHRIRDTSDLILEAVAAILRPFEREPL